jgi:hypothetical protein
MLLRGIMKLLFLIFLPASLTRSYTMRSTFTKNTIATPETTLPFHWTMRDRSASYWFQVGDSVEVLDDVMKAGITLRGRQGIVQETWEKCDVDPTCCCAEQVDVGMAVRVKFQGSEADESDIGSFFHYFAEDELRQFFAQKSPINGTAFDGKGCTAFKLDQLRQAGQDPPRIASYEPKGKLNYDDE